MQTRTQREQHLQAEYLRIGHPVTALRWLVAEVMASQRPHRHRYTCGHATGTVECWQEACTDQPELQCAACAAPALILPPLDYTRQQYEPNPQQSAEPPPIHPLLPVLERIATALEMLTEPDYRPESDKGDAHA